MLTKAHKIKRVEWAMAKITWNAEKWANTVFSGEKKFNLDGPDGLQFYWHDIRKDEQIYSTRQSGGGSVMVWGAFSAKGKTELAILDGNQDSGDYVYTLSEYLLPFIDLQHGRDCVFQQDVPPSTHLVRQRSF